VKEDGVRVHVVRVRSPHQEEVYECECFLVHRVRKDVALVRREAVAEEKQRKIVLACVDRYTQRALEASLPYRWRRRPQRVPRCDPVLDGVDAALTAQSREWPNLLRIVR
jgi:hypothetical protein